ncbi:hypothetical protein CVT26_011972 [Gymnopilus dilepis]|uniref:SnoaL-like domain-containing protein n=1 Tax=Gymnopilus dilepis TaxID=231916 RepID=A0A409VYJ8_9AGAR|nr:hypothetical protein CVT26_011972 [Gymnopilus dilepis]
MAIDETQKLSSLTEWSKAHIPSVYEAATVEQVKQSIEETFSPDLIGTVNGNKGKTRKNFLDSAYKLQAAWVEGRKVIWHQLVEVADDSSNRSGTVGAVYSIVGIQAVLPGESEPTTFERLKSVVVRPSSTMKSFVYQLFALTFAALSAYAAVPPVASASAPESGLAGAPSASAAVPSAAIPGASGAAASPSAPAASSTPPAAGGAPSGAGGGSAGEGGLGASSAAGSAPTGSAAGVPSGIPGAGAGAGGASAALASGSASASTSAPSTTVSNSAASNMAAGGVLGLAIVPLALHAALL